ncbi:MAG: hypothetical protein ACRD2W_05120 [Acidimicrobiales bacterium]
MAATTMPFDDNAYRKEVLKPLLDAESRDFGDAFAIFGLDPSVDDEAAIKARIDEVTVFWRREQSRSPRYKALVTALLSQQKDLSATLLDRSRRGALRQQIRGARAKAESERYARLEQMAAGIVPRYGGIPKSRVERLRTAGKRFGVTDPEFDSWLARYRVVADQTTLVEPLPEAVRNQIRKLLDELHMLEVTARVAESGSAPHRSMFDALGLPPDAPTATIAAHRDALGARNRQREHNRLRTVIDELLAFTTTYLIEGDRASYLAGVAADVVDRLRPEVETAILVDDRVTAPEFERLVRTAVAGGLSAPDARSAITRLAHELGGAVETGAAVDYVTCPSCGAAEVADRSRRRCRQCQTELYMACPKCRADIEASAYVCPSCGFNLRQLAEVRADAKRAQALRAEGQLAEARRVVKATAQWGELEPSVQQAVNEIEAAYRVAVEQKTSLRAALGERRFSDALSLVEVLSRTAADVSEPDGRPLDELRQQAAAGVAAVRERLAAAGKLPAGADQETALLALLAEAPDNPEVLARLRAVPVAAPSRLLAVVGPSSVKVTWRASRATGPLDYRVTREATNPDGSRDAPRSWTTDATEFEDGGCRTGTTVVYSVQARRHGIESGESRTSPVFVARDVDGLTAIDLDGSVDLRWRHPAGVGDVWVERTRTDRAGAGEPAHRVRGGVNGLIDTSVVNGATYRYKVFVEYWTPAGSPVRTEGRFVNGQPFALPEPLRGLTATADGDQVRLAWPPPESGEVSVVRVMAGTTPRAGEVVDARHLERLGEVLPADRDRTGGGVRWYVPVTVVGGQGVVGEAVRHTGLAGITDVTAADDEDDILLHWTWPFGCTEALVVWRRDGGAPASADDPSAERSKVTNMAYELKEGWRLPKAEPGTYSFQVLAGARDGSTLVWSSPSPHSGVTFERARRRGRRGR